MKVEFLPEADEEFREAARYYESEAAGVGLSFIAAAVVAVAHQRKRPNYWRVRLKHRSSGG